MAGFGSDVQMNALKCRTLGATRERTLENARAIEMRGREC